MCGKCEEVCPVRIPLPRLLRNWRFHIHNKGLTERKFNLGILIWAHLAKRPKLYHLLVGWKILILTFGSRKKGRYSYLPGLHSWTQSRDFPSPQGKTFMQQWQEKANE